MECQEIMTARKALRHMMCRMRACWEQGICGYALMELELNDLLTSVCDDMIAMQHEDGRLAACHTTAQTDAALCIHSMLKAYALTGNEQYAEAIARHRADILSTPWRDDRGVLYHFKHSRKIWADSAAMLPAALAALNMPDMALLQMKGLCERLRRADGLHSHQWNDETQAWDRSQSWSAGNGWILVGLAWTMERLGPDHPHTQKLMKLYEDLTSAMAPWQTEKGLYHDITDDTSSFMECQTAAMQQYSRLILRDMGLISPEVTGQAQAVLAEITCHMDDHGAIHDAPGAPDFMHNGTSTEMQAFYLLLWKRLNPDVAIDL